MCSKRGGFAGIGFGGWIPIPVPASPDGDCFPTIRIPVGEKLAPSPSPNRGIPRGESGIGAPLPSLEQCARERESGVRERGKDTFLLCEEAQMIRVAFDRAVQSSTSAIQVKKHRWIHGRFG